MLRTALLLLAFVASDVLCRQVINPSLAVKTKGQVLCDNLPVGGNISLVLKKAPVVPHPPPPTATVLKTVPLDENGRYLLQSTVPHFVGVSYHFVLDLTHHCVIPSYADYPAKEVPIPQEYVNTEGNDVKVFVHDYHLVPKTIYIG